MWDINTHYYGSLQFDYINLMKLEKRNPEIHIECFKALDILTNDPKTPLEIRQRLHSIIGQLVSQSLGQGNNSLAGEAGESLVRAILGSAGYKEGIHYKSQFKAGTGSDTDFVIPNVCNGEIHKVKIFIAAQFSSNDRGRMASSELGLGAERYLITGNGMDASTKTLRAIGGDIIQDFRVQNTKIVCRKSQIDKEVTRLESQASSPKPNFELNTLKIMQYRCLILHQKFQKNLAIKIKIQELKQRL